MTRIFNHYDYPEVFIRLMPSGMLPGQVGAFAMKAFKAGEVVVDGQLFEDDNIMSIEEYRLLDDVRKEMLKAHSTITPDKLFIPANLNYLKTINYFNHSCDANVGFDENDSYVATRDVPKNSEFTLDYSFLNTNPDYCMECKCGSSLCRKVITGNDWKNPAFVERYGKYFASTLREELANKI